MNTYKIIKNALSALLISGVFIYSGPNVNNVLRHFVLESIINTDNYTIKNAIASQYINLWGYQGESAISRLVQHYVNNTVDDKSDWQAIIKQAQEITNNQYTGVRFNVYRENKGELDLYKKMNTYNFGKESDYSYGFRQAPVMATEFMDEKDEAGNDIAIYIPADFNRVIVDSPDFRLYALLHELGHVKLMREGKAFNITGKDAELYCDQYSLGLLKTRLNKENYNRLVGNVAKLRELSRHDKTSSGAEYDFVDEINRLKI